MDLTEEINKILVDSGVYEFDFSEDGSDIDLFYSRTSEDYSNLVLTFNKDTGDVLFMKNGYPELGSIIDLLNRKFNKSLSTEVSLKNTNAQQIAYMREYLDISENLMNDKIEYSEATDKLMKLNKKYPCVSHISSISKNNLASTLEENWLTSSAYC